MKKSQKWLLTIVAILPSLFDYLANKQLSSTVLIFSAILIVVLWVFNLEEYRKITLEIDNKKIELEKAEKNAISAAAQVEVKADQFQKTIDAFLAYNLADFQRQGQFGASMNWEEAAKFVDEAQEMQKISTDMDENLAFLIQKSKAKVVQLFKSYLQTQFQEVRNAIENNIQTGLAWDKTDTVYHPRDLIIDFNGLKKLGDKLSEEQQPKWNVELEKFKKFYHNNFDQPL